MKTRNLFIIILSILVLVSSQVYAATCIDEIQSKNTKDFLSEIPDLDSKIKGGSCDSSVSFFKDDTVNVKIFMEGGSTETFTLETDNGKITEVVYGGSDKPTYIVGVGECEFDTFLRGQNKMGVASYL